MKHFEDKVCFMCGSRNRVEEHHIFGAANRNKSEEDGLTVFLCADCHREGRDSAHQSGKTLQLLHGLGELIWLRDNPQKNIKDFMKRYGRNYLKDYRG